MIGQMHHLDCPSKMWSNIFAFIFFCVPLFWGFRWIEITCADRNFVYFESCCFCAWGSSTQLDFWLSASKYIDFSALARFWLGIVFRVYLSRRKLERQKECEKGHVLPSHICTDDRLTQILPALTLSLSPAWNWTFLNESLSYLSWGPPIQKTRMIQNFINWALQAGIFLDHLIIMASRFKLFWCAATMWSGGLISCLIVSLLWPHQKVLVAICHGDSADAKQRKTPPSTFPNPRCLYNRQSQIVRPPSPSNSPSWLCQKPIRKKSSINSFHLWSSCHAYL